MISSSYEPTTPYFMTIVEVFPVFCYTTLVGKGLYQIVERSFQMPLFNSLLYFVIRVLRGRYETHNIIRNFETNATLKAMQC